MHEFFIRCLLQCKHICWLVKRVRKLINVISRRSEETRNKDSEESENKIFRRAKIWIIRMMKKIRKSDADNSATNRFFISNTNLLSIIFFSESRNSEEMRKITIIMISKWSYWTLIKVSTKWFSWTSQIKTMSTKMNSCSCWIHLSTFIMLMSFSELKKLWCDDALFFLMNMIKAEKNLTAIASESSTVTTSENLTEVWEDRTKTVLFYFRISKTVSEW